MQNVFEIVNKQEQTLIEIWREVIELDKDYPIGLTDNFYDLGGDSLGMLSVLNEIVIRILNNKNAEVFMNKMAGLVNHPRLKLLYDYFAIKDVGC